MGFMATVAFGVRRRRVLAFRSCSSWRRLRGRASFGPSRGQSAPDRRLRRGRRLRPPLCDPGGVSRRHRGHSPGRCDDDRDRSIPVPGVPAPPRSERLPPDLLLGRWHTRPGRSPAARCVRAPTDARHDSDDGPVGGSPFASPSDHLRVGLSRARRGLGRRRRRRLGFWYADAASLNQSAG
jgi:hypothetical protein